MIGIVVSRADHASTHIAERLLDLADWTQRQDDDRVDADGGGTYHVLDRTGAHGDERLELRTFDDLHIRLADPTPAFSERPDYLVFVSRHAGDTGPLLTCHFTGNFGAAEYGGEAGSFAPACPGVQRALLAGFDEHAPDEYGVAIEGTHHGPTALAVPAVFAEVGSDEAQWDDPAGAGAVARAVLDLPERGATVAVGDPERPRHVVGFGGGHYAPRFERVIRETAWGVGHVGIDWQLDELGHPEEHPEVLDAAIGASDADYALVADERPVLREALADRGVRVVGESWVRAVDDTPLDLVASLEAALCPVDDGLRFGERAGEGVDPDDGYRVVDLPATLLAEAQGIDADAAHAAVAAHTVGFETEQAGTRAAGRAAVPVVARDGGSDAAGPYDELVGALAAVLREKYDEVTREGDAVVARTESFDPERARTLGVPEGPKFGALSAGEAVEVNGRMIRPETVSREREEQFTV
ncbi:D-aminoacyl-tRNA deacylase [Halobaculum marinum]|uniref:D-aminoacyl-tRNA deacylase n=1 Tax=Halobaculum marinum TaxID=3031996 RepID=A0ABD5WW60_9EURY|nr:D-aminoacyl-tRNA deacylase [Halobaculum sp. DT55]